MSIQEYRASLCQPIDVGSSRLRMAGKTSDPIVLVIDCDHQNIGLGGIRSFVCRDRRKRYDQDSCEKTGLGYAGTEKNTPHKEDSNKKKLNRGIVILAIPGKK